MSSDILGAAASSGDETLVTMWWLQRDYVYRGAGPGPVKKTCVHLDIQGSYRSAAQRSGA